MAFQNILYHYGSITTFPRPPQDHDRRCTRYESAITSGPLRPPSHRHIRHAVIGITILCLSAGVCCHKEQTSLPAKPDQQQQTLIIGLVPEQSIFKQVRRCEPPADYRVYRLDRTVRLSAMPDYDHAVTRFVD
jgi:hypothetical protein